MNLIDTLKDDYSRFPRNQTYSIYTENIHFKDPLTEFRSRALFKAMLRFMNTFFINPQMDLHSIEQQDDRIKTEWTMTWRMPFPWLPKIRVDGWSELGVSEQNLIESQVDYWNCSRLDVLKQHFQLRSKS